MRDIILVTVNSIKNNLKSKILIIVTICISLMIAAGLSLFICLLLIAPEIQKSVPDRTLLGVYLNLTMYTACIICLGMNMNVFAFQTITREKSRGNLESLMVTPLSIKKIWIAKSLAIFVPGMILSEILTFAALIIVNYIYFVPRIGFVYTYWMGLSSFLALPLIYLALSFLVHIIGFAGKPATGNIIIQIFLPVMISLMINLVIRNILDAASWSFTVVNLAIAAVLAIIAIFLQPRLTKERVILSR